MLLHHILEESLNEIFVFDEGTLQFIHVNEGARQNLGFTMDELRAMTPLSIKPDYSVEQFEAYLQPLRTGEDKKAVFHTHHRRKDGTAYPVEVHLQLAKHGPVPVFVAIILDMSKRLFLMDQFLHAQRMESIGRLSGGLAHDLNNMLAGLMTGCRLARRKFERGDLEGGRALSIEIEDHVGKAAELTRHLLDHSRSATSKPKPVDVSEILESAGSVLERLLGADVALRVSNLAEGRFLADSVRIEQVVMNLCVNARDAMPEGGSLWVEAADVEVLRAEGDGLSRSTRGPHVALCVRDTGFGMSPDVAAKAFEPYYTTKEVGRGTGLGLSSVAQIVQDAGGFIEFETQTGAGTSFRLFFPACHEGANSRPEAPAVMANLGDGETILVVEDEALLRATLKDLLEELGYRPLTAANPELALALTGEHPDPIDLIMTDVVLPGMGGAEMVARIRKEAPHTPVLFMSGYAESSLLKRGSIEQNSHFLEKPFTVEALAERLRTSLDVAAPD